MDSQDSELICQKCGHEMDEYVPGIGRECRCTNCGHKDPCCE